MNSYASDMKKDDVIVLLAGFSRRWGATRIGLRQGDTRGRWRRVMQWSSCRR